MLEETGTELRRGNWSVMKPVHVGTTLRVSEDLENIA